MYRHKKGDARLARGVQRVLGDVGKEDSSFVYGLERGHKVVATVRFPSFVVAG